MLVLAALAPAASAHAAPSVSVKVASCQTGDQSSDRRATFLGQMRAVPGAVQLAMRFELEEQYGGQGFTRVTTQALRTWHRSKPNVKSYSYAQSVNGLLAGETYRMQVQFRWLDDNGRTIDQTRRHSSTCTQPGDLPNLKVLDLTGRPGMAPGTEAYTVYVANTGLAPAEHVPVQLVIDGATPDTVTVDSLGVAEVRPIHFTGPACRHRVRATVDPADLVHESSERDDTLLLGCPPQG